MPDSAAPPLRGLLLDLDGTVYQAERAIPGAAAALARLRAAGIALRFVTNTTRRPRRELAARLRAMGIEVAPEELVTAPAATAAWLRKAGAERLLLCLPPAAHEEFAGFVLAGPGDREVDHVVVGDLGEEWTFERLNDAFQRLLRGARLVAIQRNRFWQTARGPTLDAGPFVAALELAAGCEAVVVGKPSPAIFDLAVASLGLAAGEVAMVGDDLEVDVAGAQRAGIRGIAVRTGKYADQVRTARAGVPPDAVLDSVADLPAWLGVQPYPSSLRS